MDIQLSDHFTYRKLIRFTIPSIVMMIFSSIYSVVDGFFISNYVGETAFAAVNLIFPYCMVFSAAGSIFGVGGSALIAMVKGQGDDDLANRIFSMLVYTMIAVSAVLALLSEFFLPQVTDLLGATEEMRGICILYGRIIIAALPAMLLQWGFQSYMITAERPNVGLLVTVGAGVTNMFLDWLFVGVFHWDVVGAAAATVIGQCVGGIVPVIYFLTAKDLPLKFVKTKFMPWAFGKAASNGMADGITNIAMSVVNIVFNLQLMKYMGEYGVSAYGVIMYVNFFFVGVFFGYSMGIAPAFSFHYGAKDEKELQNLFGKSMKLISSAAVILTALGVVTAGPLSRIFAGYDPEFLNITVHAVKLYSLSYLFCGFNIFTSNLFAALNNGPVSAAMSFLRTFVFQILAVLLLPVIIGIDGIWLAILTAELCVFLVSLIVLKKQNSKYHYVG